MGGLLNIAMLASSFIAICKLASKSESYITVEQLELINNHLNEFNLI